MAARTTRRTDEALKILEVLRVPSFRPHQWELISALVLERRNVFAQLACGAGKTLVFIASLLLQCMTPGVGAIGLLVVPIDSIVSDAKRTLASYGIEVVELTADTERRVIALLESDTPPSGPVVVISKPRQLVAPQSGVLKALGPPDSVLKAWRDLKEGRVKLDRDGRIILPRRSWLKAFAVDEAHCVDMSLVWVLFS